MGVSGILQVGAANFPKVEGQQEYLHTNIGFSRSDRPGAGVVQSVLRLATGWATGVSEFESR
jgi:hypothetical protein